MRTLSDHRFLCDFAQGGILFQGRILQVILGIFVAIVLAEHGALAQKSYEVIVQNGAPMKTRDGVTLRADIYRPKDDGKFPVILMRTPYDKSVGWAASPAYQIAGHGYVVVVQDVRGRYTSEGEFYPFRHESDDGYDAVEWVAALPSSNGKVGMIGGSYVGATQMLAAIVHPPHLAGICPVVTASNYHDNWTYQGGALEQWFDQNWATQLATNTLWRLIAKDTNALLGAPTLPLAQYPAFNYAALPAGAAATAQIAPYYLDWLAHPSYDAYWKQWSIEEHFSDIQVPALHIGGVEFGDEALKFPPTSVVIDWYDYLFKGAQNEFATDGSAATGKPVHIFVMGEDKYHQESDWPPPEGKLTRYFLRSGGSANSLRGDGGLSVTPPKKKHRINSHTIQQILCLRSAARSAATPNTTSRVRATNAPLKIATTCSSIRPSRLPKIRKSPARSRWSCGPNRLSWTLTLRPSLWTSHQMALPPI